jgi:hypothetical protein
MAPAQGDLLEHLLGDPEPELLGLTALLPRQDPQHEPAHADHGQQRAHDVEVSTTSTNIAAASSSASVRCRPFTCSVSLELAASVIGAHHLAGRDGPLDVKISSGVSVWPAPEIRHGFRVQRRRRSQGRSRRCGRARPSRTNSMRRSSMRRGGKALGGDQPLGHLGDGQVPLSSATGPPSAHDVPGCRPIRSTRGDRRESRGSDHDDRWPEVGTIRDG